MKDVYKGALMIDTEWKTSKTGRQEGRQEDW